MKHLPPSIQTRRLILRPFGPSDAPAIAAALNDPQMSRGLLMVPFPYLQADAEWFIAEGAQDALAVCLKDGPLVGAMGLGNTLGYWIAKEHWGMGYATEAAKPLLTRHFSSFGTPVKSSYIDDNHGSARVLEKLGFEIVGNTLLQIKSRNAEIAGKSVVLTKQRWEQLT
ncbi:GNAT family N-acetyltransferase [uncultured Sulfitobacter sp.]|uniref:GNAT family N-acetyltransferase n=1 Tax=uncultured Sulfitobacter sp. TaxID=191468 RepID=UPI00260D9709|nr:GNAT family N-acetyltransferase [uncultured Sulfitobacter sp.]